MRFSCLRIACLSLAALVALAAAPLPAMAEDAHGGIECASYARERAGILLFGDAVTWWDQAKGLYARGTRPSPGAVLLLHNYSASQSGHAAIVTRIVGPREIRIDHANWLHDGAIYRNNPVVDVSPANDWSQVRVMNLQTGAWGSKVYPVRGFLRVAPQEQKQEDRDARPASPFALTEVDRNIPSRLDE